MGLVKGVTYEEIKKPDMRSRVKKEQPKPVETTNNDVVVGMNFDIFKEVGSIPLDIQDDPQPRRTTQPRKKANNVSSTGVVPVEENNRYSATEPYMNKYQETNALLKTTIVQIDIGLQDTQQDLALLRNNKTLRNKYQSISMIQKNVGDLLGNKIQAIKELNNTISKCQDLELKRAKELKELENQDDDKRIMDLYNAMISMPVGGQSGMMNNGFATPLGPNTFQMTYAGNPKTQNSNIVTSVDMQDDYGYQSYLQNKTPAQNMMSLDNNPNIQQVVVHNRATGQSYFEIMDMSTMRPVPNTDKYDNSFFSKEMIIV